MTDTASVIGRGCLVTVRDPPAVGASFTNLPPFHLGGLGLLKTPCVFIGVCHGLKTKMPTKENNAASRALLRVKLKRGGRKQRKAPLM